MLIVKIMSSEDTADSDARKSFALHAGVKSAIFERRGDGTSDDPSTFRQPWLSLLFADGEKEAFEPQGNVYVMNERGQTVASYGVAPIIYAQAGPATGDPRGEIGPLVDRFLSWRLPKTFNPDGGIRFDAPAIDAHWPSGTNLLDYSQAKAMLEHVLAP